MFSKLKNLVPVLIMSLSLSGCGDLLGTKVMKKGLDGAQFEVNCELDMNAFEDIMTRHIGRQIRCLGENLNLFIQIVKSGKPGYLSRVQLERYLADFRPDVKPEVVSALGAVFQISHLITGEDPNYISKESVDKVVNFALVFNEEAALNFGPIFQNENPVSYALHQSQRDIVSSANKTIIQSLRKIFNPNRNGDIHQIDIVELLKSFTTEDNRGDIETAKKVLFVKKLLLGGESNILTHTELEKLILNFDQLLLITLDAVRYKYIILKQDSILQLLKRDVTDLYEMITQGRLNNRDEEVLFTMDQLVDAAKVLLKNEDFDIDTYRSLIDEGKIILMSGNANEFKGKEIKLLFSHAQSLLKTGTVFHRIYDKFRVKLDSPQPVNIDFSEYRHTYPEHQNELDQFERIVKNYRFMKGEFLSAYYSRGQRRNPDAVFEVALFEYALKLAFVKYGSPSPTNTVGGYSINKDQMRALILKFENELIDMGILTPQKAINTADNISLLGSLFQFQSDENKVMDINEASEFASSLFTSINVSDEMYKYIVDQGCPLEEFSSIDARIYPKCFRENYWKALCSNYREYYPLLFDSLNAPKKCEDWVNTPESDVFLDKLIVAARTCHEYTDGNKEEIPYTKGDIMTIHLAMSHVETTILRWDTNNNNIMDANEVMDAYSIYSPALDGFMEGKSAIIKKLKKQIYQYMIKYEQIPDEKEFKSIWKFVKFLLSFNKKSPANRKTIASILVTIGEQNKLLQTGPVFDCNLLRDPENIPREPMVNKVRPVDTRPDLSHILKPYLHLAD